MQTLAFLLIDGTQPGDSDLSPILALLYKTLRASGASVRPLSLRDLKLGHCVGCFGCWLKTPGQCVQPDSGREVMQSILRSDTVILFGPVSFGTYSPELKRLVDRCLSPLNLPYLQVSDHETRHEPRYDRYPRLIVVGVQRQPDPAEAALFKLIAGRHALHLHAPAHAASVVTVSDSPEQLRIEFLSLLDRNDPLPHPKTLKALLPAVKPDPEQPKALPCEEQALLLVGSPKARPSTSAALGGHLMQRLKEQGWRIETLKLRARLREPGARSELMDAMDRANLIVLAFPLYNDSLPYPVLTAMQTFAKQRSAQPSAKSQRMVVIANNGFPEPHHTLPAVAVCRRFAEVCGLEWAGGLLVGGGEALCAGQPLLEINRTLPSVQHLITALDLAAGSLAEGGVVPLRAAHLIARNPIFPAPFASYRWIFKRVAARRWEREAAENGLTPSMLRARPYQNLITE